MKHRRRELAIGLLLSVSALVLTTLLVEGSIALFWHPIAPRVDSRTLGGAMTTSGITEWGRFVPDTRAVAVSPTAEFAVPYEINSLGMRDRERSRRKRGDKARILVLGDSFAEGYGVLREESFPAIAEAQAPDRWEWINGGIRGLSPGKAYFRLQSFLQIGLQIDLVLLQVHDNDFDDDQLHTENMELAADASGLLTRRPPIGIEKILGLAGPFEWRVSHSNLYRLLHFRRFTATTGLAPYELSYEAPVKEGVVNAFREHGIEGLEVGPERDSLWPVRFPDLPDKLLPPEALRELWKVFEYRNLSLGNRRARKMLQALVSGRRRPPLLPLEDPPPEDVLTTFSYLDALLQLSREHDLPLLVYYQPRSKKLLLSPENQWFEEWCRSRGIPFLSLREQLLVAVVQAEDPLFYPIDGHLTAAGHEWVGVRLASWMQEQLEQK